ncbi:hypothetical protein RHMOL_Rhmol02G0319200 [Rhododendron molle]|uniref:Uncharacterized protein n=1 Tax=Rhododendron molle TaxID=49168 RepID=A0ACC0PWY2_RHOML|nr:hypothetical protein RHMOL_Rhmol02G0319200 [Rhododendron molle]
MISSTGSMISSTSLISALPLVPLRRRCDGCCQSSIRNSFLSVSLPWFYPKIMFTVFVPVERNGLVHTGYGNVHYSTCTLQSMQLVVDLVTSDEFASLPAIVPRGPIAIFGLGAGTAAHLMLDLWPSLELHGWEIDQILVDKAREYFALSDLEKRTPTGGILHVCVGDALSPSVNVSGGYAGIVVDLFSDGKVLPQLQEVSTWLELHGKLMPNGRFMVNCGAANDGVYDTTSPESWSIDRSWVQNSTIRALCQAFPREVRARTGKNSSFYRISRAFEHGDFPCTIVLENYVSSSARLDFWVQVIRNEAYKKILEDVG